MLPIVLPVRSGVECLFGDKSPLRLDSVLRENPVPLRDPGEYVSAVYNRHALHSFLPGLPEEWGYVYHLLFSRHSSKARTAGTIQPKILTQVGTCIPFIAMSTWEIILTRCAADIPTSKIVTTVVAGFMLLLLSIKARILLLSVQSLALMKKVLWKHGASSLFGSIGEISAEVKKKKPPGIMTAGAFL